MVRLWEGLQRALVRLGIVGLVIYALKLQERREAERAQDAALQAYLDQMTELLLHEKLRTSQGDDEVRNVARARTLTVLRVLLGVRKAAVVQFLYEARLIGGIEQEEDGERGTIEAIVNWTGADLQGADLQGADLDRAYLFRADLGGANLEGANLDWANLEGANLEAANLLRAHLYRANVEAANLEGANLQWAILERADLYGAGLQRADLKWAYLEAANLDRASLREADLTYCKVTREQLAQARSLEGAKLPFDMAPPAPEVEITPPTDQAADLRGGTTPDGSKHE